MMLAGCALEISLVCLVMRRRNVLYDRHMFRWMPVVIAFGVVRVGIVRRRWQDCPCRGLELRASEHDAVLSTKQLSSRSAAHRFG